MGLEETKAKYDSMILALQAAVPEGKESEFEAQREKLLELVPEETRKDAYDSAMALSDDESFACVNQLALRAGLRKGMSPLVIAFFSNPFWRELFARANQSPAAKAKREKNAGG